MTPREILETLQTHDIPLNNIDGQGTAVDDATQAQLEGLVIFLRSTGSRVPRRLGYLPKSDQQ